MEGAAWHRGCCVWEWEGEEIARENISLYVERLEPKCSFRPSLLTVPLCSC